MAKTRQQKEDAVKQLGAELDKKGVVFFHYGGLKVSEMEELRGKLREENAIITVAKRTLLRNVLSEKGLTGGDAITGPVAVASADDEVMPAKLVAEYKKEHEQIEFYGGLLEESFIDEAKVSHLASLPSKQELLAKAVGSMKAPINGFVNVLSGNLRGLVTVLGAIKDNK